MNEQGTNETSSEDAAIAALLGDLNAGTQPVTPDAPQLPVETIESDGGLPLAGETNVEAAIPEAGAVETTEVDAKAAKAAQKAADKVAKLAAKAEAKAAREKVAADKKAAKEAAKAATPEGDKKPAEKRVYFADRADRIAHRLGDSLGNFMVWEAGDATLPEAGLKAKQDANFAIVKAMAKKVKNRASLLLDYCAGKSEGLNSVISIAFKLLHRDGSIVTGDKGNYLDTLQHGGKGNAINPRPYSLNAARAMGNNSIKLLKDMKVLVPGGADQTYVANPESTILAVVNGKLGLK